MSFPILKLARLFAVGLLLTAVVLLFVNPKPENNLPEGFSTPIIAFEFIQTKQEIINFFTVKDVAKYESDMLLGNAIDYLFMFLYSAFLYCIALLIKKQTNAKTMLPALFFCLLMWIGDALENYQIYQLVLKYKDNMDIVSSVSSYNYYDIHITLLKFFTWLKWGSIAITFLLFSPFFLKKKKAFHKVIGVLCISSFVLCLAAFFKHGVLNEVFSTNVVLVFVLLTVFVFRLRHTSTGSV